MKYIKWLRKVHHQRTWEKVKKMWTNLKQKKAKTQTDKYLIEKPNQSVPREKLEQQLFYLKQLTNTKWIRLDQKTIETWTNLKQKMIKRQKDKDLKKLSHQPVLREELEQ